MTVVVLVLTHTAACAVGAAVMWLCIVRLVNEIEEHPVTEGALPPTVADPPPGYHGWRWLAVGLTLIFIGLLGLYNSRQNSDQTDQLQQQQQCFNAYVSGVAPYAQAVGDTSQKLWDDFKKFQSVDPADQGAMADLRRQFFHDLDLERAANDALQKYRATHIPAKTCP